MRTAYTQLRLSRDTFRLSRPASMKCFSGSVTNVHYEHGRFIHLKSFRRVAFLKLTYHRTLQNRIHWNSSTISNFLRKASPGVVHAHKISRLAAHNCPTSLYLTSFLHAVEYANQMHSGLHIILPVFAACLTP